MKSVSFKVPEFNDLKQSVKNAPENAKKIAGWTIKAIGLGFGIASVQIDKAASKILESKKQSDGPKE